MFNSTFKNRGKGLTRSAPLACTQFERKPEHKGLKSKAPLTAASGKHDIVVAKKPHSTLKSRPAPKSKIRQSANGEGCTLRLPGVCKPEPGNVVWAHSNRGEHGKGGGLKANDEWGAYACYWCHCVYDRQHKRPAGMTLEFVEGEFSRGMQESRAKLRAKGLIPPDAGA
ncbi:nuclease domain-containing protein [Burkholderia anthina]|uniref:nuclease domain-containing protein n=1 Tax=Burkholderia anthina TaxID=179879 RepID=UPI00158C1C77|nr:nuclease domain-containing protein [Burkholderia anthina]